MRSTTRLIALTLALFAAPGAAARAETTSCTAITGPSYTISAPGIYCLKGPLHGGVVVDADDVVIDLNGHALESTEAGKGGGIYALDRKNVAVRNGTIRGFFTGIELRGAASRGHLVERLQVSDNARNGILLEGNGSVVRDNVLINNCYLSSAQGVRYAIFARGTGVQVQGNVVTETGVGETTASEIVGIKVSGSGLAVERNVVGNEVLGSPGSRGISVIASGKSSVVGNRVFNMRGGIVDILFSGKVLFMDNAVGGADFAYSGGVMAGSTNYSF